MAERVIEREAQPAPPFVELVSVPAGDLSGLRHALWPLVVDPEPLSVLDALLGTLHRDLESGTRNVVDTMTIVRQMRSMVRLPPPLYASVNAMLVAHAEAPNGAALEQWLRHYSKASLDLLKMNRR